MLTFLLLFALDSIRFTLRFNFLSLHGMFLQTFQQLNGQNFYYYYGPTFFKKAAVSLNSYQIQFILGAVSWVATWPALYLIEKLGRRQSLLIGSVGCAACAFIVAFVGR